jgi:hypothetical protein
MAHTIGNCRASQSSLSQRTFRRRDCDRLSLLAAADRLGGRSSPSALARALDMHSSRTLLRLCATRRRAVTSFGHRTP